MDNYQLYACHQKRTRNRNSNNCHTRWQHSFSQHNARWLESIANEELNIFIGIHGPSKIPRVKDRIHLTIQPYLEVVDRHNPDTPPKIYSLGEQSTLEIVGIIDFKKTIDKERGLFKIVVFTTRNFATTIEIEAPSGYQLPLYKRRLFCPLAGSKFHMLYAAPFSQGQCQGAISKIYHEGKLIEQYVPQYLQ